MNKIEISLLYVIVAIPCFSLAVRGQSADLLKPAFAPPAANFTPPRSSLTLPDAPPSPAVDVSDLDDLIDAKQSGIRFAPKYANTIEPEYHARPMGYTGKIAFAATELFSLHYAAGAVIAAGVSQGLQSNPKYGTNSEAFAQRFGAAAARGASQIVLSEVVLAPVLHEDSRYYVLGSSHRLKSRVLYAMSRVVVTRSDSGHRTLNIADLTGYAGTSVLTQLYYPQGGRNIHTVLIGYGSSLGGLAIQNGFSEFARFLIRGQPR